MQALDNVLGDLPKEFLMPCGIVVPRRKKREIVELRADGRDTHRFHIDEFVEAARYMCKGDFYVHSVVEELLLVSKSATNERRSHAGDLVGCLALEDSNLVTIGEKRH